HEAEHLSASLALERGLTLAEQGEVAQGMLWLARGLKIAPTDDADLQRDLRTSLAVWQRQLHPLRAVIQHPEIVTSVKFTRDGKLLATGCNDGIVRLWDLVTGLKVDPAMHHEGWGDFVIDLSPDSKLLVTKRTDGVVRLWQTGSGKQLPF